MHIQIWTNIWICDKHCYYSNIFWNSYVNCWMKLNLILYYHMHTHKASFPIAPAASAILIFSEEDDPDLDWDQCLPDPKHDTDSGFTPQQEVSLLSSRKLFSFWSLNISAQSAVGGRRIGAAIVFLTEHGALKTVVSGLLIEIWEVHEVGTNQHVPNWILCKAADLNQWPVQEKSICSDSDQTAQLL